MGARGTTLYLVGEVDISASILDTFSPALADAAPRVHAFRTVTEWPVAQVYDGRRIWMLVTQAEAASPAAALAALARSPLVVHLFQSSRARSAAARGCADLLSLVDRSAGPRSR